MSSKLKKRFARPSVLAEDNCPSSLGLTHPSGRMLIRIKDLDLVTNNFQIKWNLWQYIPERFCGNQWQPVTDITWKSDVSPTDNLRMSDWCIVDIWRIACKYLMDLLQTTFRYLTDASRISDGYIADAWWIPCRYLAYWMDIGQIGDFLYATISLILKNVRGIGQEFQNIPQLNERHLPSSRGFYESRSESGVVRRTRGHWLEDYTTCGVTKEIMHGWPEPGICYSYISVNTLWKMP